MTVREAIGQRARQVGAWRAVFWRLTGLALLVPFVIIARDYGLMAGAILAIVIGWAAGKGMDALYFASRVRCPKCNGRLWRCLENGPRGRRLVLREDALSCPFCGVDFARPLEGSPDEAGSSVQ